MVIPKFSRWKGIRKGEPFALTVIGIWATGGGDHYQVQSYELQVKESGAVINMAREEIITLVHQRKLIRTDG